LYGGDGFLHGGIVVGGIHEEGLRGENASFQQTAKKGHTQGSVAFHVRVIEPELMRLGQTEASKG
jgi:hypothetical protein